jgi:exodeoxyribonuclease VII large subunit
MATATARPGVLTVTELTRRIREALEEGFPGVWVRGEITGFRRAPSGHRYFALKDDRAAIECALYATEAGRLKFDPRDGLAVEAFGRISVFEQRGRYQLVVETMRPAGLGDRLLALEELKRRLQAEGLFDPARKRPLPRFPRRVGIVTSPVGAAVRDVIKVLRNRWRSIGIVLAPVRVQGEGAAAEIAAAIERFNRYGGVDLLIVGRGGGSLEDLWAFNEESVARAIAASRLPVISAVGHEVDVTLADLIADVRAATPSNAAEIAVRDRAEIRHRVEALAGRMRRATTHGLRARRQRLDHALQKYGFRSLVEVVADWRRKVADWTRLTFAQVRRVVEERRRRLEAARGAYGLRTWPQLLGERREEIAASRDRLDAAMAGRIASLEQRRRGFGDRLRALSPRLVLERGYCLVRGPDGTLLRTSAGLVVGDPIRVEFSRGEADARVEAVRTGEEHAT